LAGYDLPVATGLTVAAATAFPNALAPLTPAAEVRARARVRVRVRVGLGVEEP